MQRRERGPRGGRVRPATAAVLPGLVLVAALFGDACDRRSSPAGPAFGRAFWDHWGDGRAELDTYDLVFPRYGHDRAGVAVLVFVTETFSHEARVKADPDRHSARDEFPVMKLNLVQDFSTGIYDYQLMTSAFYALAPQDGRPSGSPAKIVFSAQEWCGQVFQELLPDAGRIRFASHSYFDGEGDRSGELPYPRDAVLEDGLFHWARGLAFPRLAPGESLTVPLLRSAELVRLGHVPLRWETARLSRSRESSPLDVPAGVFAADTLTVAIDGERARTWTFRVEAEAPRRILRWESTDGRRAELIRSDRLAYWKMNEPGFEEQLGRLGLSPRPPRTP